MKRHFILSLLIAFVALNNYAINNTEIKLDSFPGLKQKTYIHTIMKGEIDGRFSSFAPFFLIYPDKPCSKEEAEKLIKELGLDIYHKKYLGSIAVMNPIGKTYDNKSDLQAYKDYITAIKVVTNLKIIGIGNGATFVNQAIAQNAGAIATIVSINGKPGKVVKGSSLVPAYIYGNNSLKVGKNYIIQDNAKLKSDNENISIYENQSEPLHKVIISKSKNKALKNIIDEAWETLMCKNYRFNNYYHTWYTGCSYGQYGDYEIEPYIMLEELKIERNVVEKDLLNTGKFLWYEYRPKSIQNAPKGTVPLLILLHGNNNDPKTQAETSGFIELCAKENFMVAELEWQGNGYTPMGLDGIEQVIYYLLNTYPELDASRIYAEGLSAGSVTATGLGIRKSYLFAAVGGHSAGIFSNRYAFGYNKEAIQNEATQKRGFVEMPYFAIAGTDDDAVPFISKDNWKENSFYNAWKTYQILNGLEICDEPDFEKNPLLGFTLSDYQKIETSKNVTIETGYMYKNDVPLVQIVALIHYGHWNYKPIASMMWNYFKHFSRNTTTKELEYTK